MNRIFLILPLFLHLTFVSGQDNSYSDIEVWGIADSARARFFGLHQEKDLPICAASLRTLGYPDGNRIILEDGRQILTLRDFPVLPWEDQFTPKRSFPASGVWEELLELDMFGLESQLTHLYYRAFLSEDSSRFAQLLREHQDQFGLYGFVSDEQKMRQYCETLSKMSLEIRLEEVMEILHFADSSSTEIKLAAAFLLPALIQTDNEALALLPLLFDPDANRIQHVLRYYFLLPNKQVEWSPELSTLSIVLAHPDPLVVTDLIEILNHTGIDPDLVPEILSQGAITLQEILLSEFAESWQEEVMSFLEKMHIIHPGTTPEETVKILDRYRQE